MSATYRQDSRIDAEELVIDPTTAISLAALDTDWTGKYFATKPSMLAAVSMVKWEDLPLSLTSPVAFGMRWLTLTVTRLTSSGSRRRSLPKELVHILETNGSATQHGGFRCAIQRELQCEAGANEHAATSSHPHERQAVCGSSPSPC